MVIPGPVPCSDRLLRVAGERRANYLAPAPSSKRRGESACSCDQMFHGSMEGQDEEPREYNDESGKFARYAAIRGRTVRAIPWIDREAERHDDGRIGRAGTPSAAATSNYL